MRPGRKRLDINVHLHEQRTPGVHEPCSSIMLTWGTLHSVAAQLPVNVSTCCAAAVSSETCAANTRDPVVKKSTSWHAGCHASRMGATPLTGAGSCSASVCCPVSMLSSPSVMPHTISCPSFAVLASVVSDPGKKLQGGNRLVTTCGSQRSGMELIVPRLLSTPSTPEVCHGGGVSPEERPRRSCTVQHPQLACLQAVADVAGRRCHEAPQLH